MSNYALILAGGTGRRMNRDTPKQFLYYRDRPVIIYTLEVFQKHPDIDGIAVVCLKGWETVLRSYADKFDITKLKWIFPGGKTGQESIYNGIMGLKNAGCRCDDVILVHDGVRPLLSQTIISSNIACCKANSNAITGITCREAVLESADGFVSYKSIPRDKLIRTQTPQTFILDDLVAIHKEAYHRGIQNSVSSCTLIAEIGNIEMHIVQGEEKNIKITTQEDFEIFKLFVDSL